MSWVSVNKIAINYSVYLKTSACLFHTAGVQVQEVQV